MDISISLSEIDPAWVFVAFGGLCILFVIWMGAKVLVGRKKAHSRPVSSFWNQKYGLEYKPNQLLVARNKESALLHENKVHNYSDDLVLKLSHKALQETHISYGDVNETVTMNYFKPLTHTFSLPNGNIEVHHVVENKGGLKSTFTVGDIVLTTEADTSWFGSNASYHVKQNGKAVGILFTESDAFGDIAMSLLLNVELPEAIKAFYLALETRRIWYWPGMPTGR